MSIVTRLIDLIADKAHGAQTYPSDTVPDERLAAAALLVHVARVDGRVSPKEEAAVARIVREAFGLDEAAAGRLIRRADNLDREVDDVASLIDMLGHGSDESERRRLLVMAYRVAAADGTLQEFEEDLVWRVGHLLGFGEAAIGNARDAALGASDAG